VRLQFRAAARTNGIRLWHSRRCATLTFVVTPPSTTISCDPSLNCGSGLNLPTFAGASGITAVRRFC
jgi:hypothetical protein